MGEGRLASSEFQMLLDHRGIVGEDVTGALAHLQVARAQKMMSDQAAARKSYEDFLKLWKEADSDIPIYQQAKAEYARLRPACMAHTELGEWAIAGFSKQNCRAVRKVSLVSVQFHLIPHPPCIRSRSCKGQETPWR
jgi:hypothetical protein